MRNTWLVIVAVASLVLNLAVVGAYLYHQRGPRPPRPPLAGLRREMHQQARDVFRKSWPEMQRLGEERARLQTELLQELTGPDVNQARVDSLADALGRLHAQSVRIISRDARAVVELLPAEQREQFLRNFGPLGGGHHGARAGRMMRHFRGMPGPGMEPPPGPPPEQGR